MLRSLLDMARNSVVQRHLPVAYFDRQREIVPLRFVWTQPDGSSIRARFDGFLDVGSTWFLQPIIATRDPIGRFGYHKGQCPISERVGPGMVNLPCNLSQDDSIKLIELFHANISPGRDVPLSRESQVSEH